MQQQLIKCLLSPLFCKPPRRQSFGTIACLQWPWGGTCLCELWCAFFALSLNFVFLNPCLKDLPPIPEPICPSSAHRFPFPDLPFPSQCHLNPARYLPLASSMLGPFPRFLGRGVYICSACVQAWGGECATGVARAGIFGAKFFLQRSAPQARRKKDRKREARKKIRRITPAGSDHPCALFPCLCVGGKQHVSLPVRQIGVPVAALCHVKVCGKGGFAEERERNKKRRGTSKYRSSGETRVTGCEETLARHGEGP